MANSSDEEKSRQAAEKERQALQEEKAEMREQRQEWAEERTEWAEQRTEWADQRTEWAEHRSILANERTFSAWLRTGLSAMGGGVAVVEFLGGDEATWIARVLGVILILTGAGVVVLALWRYNQIRNVLEADGLPVTPKWVAFTLSGGLLVGAVLVLALIFMQ
jgi:putative membrane protein